MARRHSFHHLRVFLDRSPISRRLAFPVDEATAAPVIKYMDNMLEPENLAADGERPRAAQEELYDQIMRAKGDLELILKRRVELQNC
jgi:hypothetical protein